MELTKNLFSIKITHLQSFNEYLRLFQKCLKSKIKTYRKCQMYRILRLLRINMF